MQPGAIEVKNCRRRICRPTRLLAGRMAVYVFALGSEVLTVGKVGAKSQVRYRSNTLLAADWYIRMSGAGSKMTGFLPVGEAYPKPLGRPEHWA